MAIWLSKRSSGVAPEVDLREHVYVTFASSVQIRKPMKTRENIASAYFQNALIMFDEVKCLHCICQSQALEG